MHAPMSLHRRLIGSHSERLSGRALRLAAFGRDPQGAQGVQDDRHINRLLKQGALQPA